MNVILASLLWSVVHVHGIAMQHRLDRLQTVGRVLYVAAHPDDENTQLLAYLTHELHTRTAYLSLTRGDGGQNLIGSEQSPLMGVIRTHELLEARALDGAEQRFTRARDFGYSKRSEEALSVWGREATLGDVVWAIRRYRPHVILTRFPETGNTHGHHLASAILAREAFAAAADPERFPEQLDRASPWQAERLLFNVPNRFMPDEERPDDLVVDIGGYDAASGLSHGEIAARSRTMHKSQGFGAARRFGPEPERFRHLAGSEPKEGLLDGIDTSWASVEGGAPVGDALAAARASFRPDRPEAMIPELVRAMEALDGMADEHLATWAREEIGQLLIGASGLLLEARAETAQVVPGEALPVELELLLRRDAPVSLKGARVAGDEGGEGTLETNVPKKVSLTATVAKDASPTLFPWLEKPPGAGRYRGSGDPDLPLAEPPVTVEVDLSIGGVVLPVRVPVRHHRVDRVRGEITREVEIVPPVTVTPEAKAVVLPCAEDGCEARLRVSVKVRKPGTVRFTVPEGYSVEPTEVAVDADRELELAVRAGRGASPGELEASVDGAPALAERTLRHDHIPERTVLLPASVRLAPVELEVPRFTIGHVAGPGDDVADGLRRVGAQVVELDDEALAHGDLDRFGAILVGVRAFNTREALQLHHQRLFDFAEGGGTVVVQYVTKPRRGPFATPLLPRAMELGRGRVTDHTAAVTFLEPEHPLLRQPHAIDDDDFAGWVQERGLYFAESWDEGVTPLLSLADTDEEPQEGSLLVANHGAGRVVYCGLSLFRQFPAGVPGAYRLLTNLLMPADIDARDRTEDPTAASVDGPDAPPPVLGRWRNFYAVVLLVLLVFITSFYVLTKRYGA